jgi:hypothetical protein
LVLRLVGLVLATALPAPPQRPGEATSVVVDATGQPIAGARVSVVLAAAGDTLYGHHALDVLARAPLRDITTDSQGRFTLPLTAAHRRLGTGHEPAMTLLVAADGYQEWHEPLPFGLTGFRGTRAVLQRLRDDEVVTVTVAGAPPGALLWVRRIDCGAAGAEARLLPVPPDGVVRVRTPLLPTPCVLDDWRQTRGLGHEVQLWLPGHSSAPSRLVAGEPAVRFGAQSTATRTLAVRCADAPATAVRGLYACPDGARRWFASPDDRVREDACLRLIAVTADGCGTAVPDSGSLDPVELEPVRAGHAGLRLTVRGRDLLPARTEARLVDLVCWPHAGRARFLPLAAHALPLDGSTLSVPVAAWQQHALLITAAGCAPRVLPPLRGTPPEHLELLPATLAEASLLAIDADGEPVAGAEVRLPLTTLADSPRTVAMPTTDGMGAFALPPLPPGNVQALCVTDAGYGQLRMDVKAKMAPPVLREVLRELRAQREDSLRREWLRHNAVVPIEGHVLRADLGAPFAPVTIESRTRMGEQRTRRGFADALGRVHVGYLGHEATLTCRGVQSSPHALDAALDVIVLRVPNQQHVLVELPADARVKRVSFWHRDGGTRHENLELDTDRLLLGWRAGCARCDVVLASGPPATVVAADLKDSRQEDHDVLRVDRTRVLRRVHLHVFSGGLPVHGFSVRSRRAEGLLLYDERDGDPLRDNVWCARDGAAHELLIFHRAFLPAPAQVQEARTERDAALIVELTRGTPIRFRIPSQSAPPAGHDVTITLYDDGKPQAHVKVVSPGPGEGGAVEFPLPFALRPGHYAAELATGREVRRVTFVVDGAGEVTVE